MKVSIILPSLNRPTQLVKSILSCKETIKDFNSEIVVILDDKDYRSRYALGNLDIPFILDSSPTDAVTKWNVGARKADGDWLFLANDDHNWPENWLKGALDTPNKGFIGVQDQFGDNKSYAPFYLAHRDWLRKYQGGVLAVPHYHSWGIDIEISERAKKVYHYVTSPVKLHHAHHYFGESIKDSTYERAERFHKADMELFSKRAALGFPDDFKGYL